ncbi:hypothetical protein PWT90_10759 [Aphanocladium album]|nr:hypothetical protein PWT90_10759 [Aphanocladium album]
MPRFAPTIETLADAWISTAEPIFESNEQLQPLAPIRIDLDMFCTSDQSSGVLSRLVQFYHQVAGNLTSVQQADFLAMLHTSEWRFTVSTHCDVLRHDVMRRMVRKRKDGSLVFCPDEMSLNRLAIILATYPERVKRMEMLGLFSAFEQVQIGYFACPEVYRRHWTTSLPLLEFPDISEHANLGPLAVVQPAALPENIVAWIDASEAGVDPDSESATISPAELASRSPTRDATPVCVHAQVSEPPAQDSSESTGKLRIAMQGCRALAYTFTDRGSFLQQLNSASATIEAYGNTLLQELEKRFRKDQEALLRQYKEERETIAQIVQHINASNAEMEEAWTKLGILLPKYQE